MDDSNAESSFGPNPFADRPDWKKRVITVSVTKPQHDAFLKLQADMNMASGGALIKKLLHDEIERRND